MLFFYTAISKFNKNYTFLFAKKSDENEGQENEIRNFEAPSQFSRFTKRWGWFYLIDNVARTTNETWDKVFEIPICAFLNICAYIQDKNAMEKEQINNLKKGNVKRY